MISKKTVVEFLQNLNNLLKATVNSDKDFYRKSYLCLEQERAVIQGAKQLGLHNSCCPVESKKYITTE